MARTYLSILTFALIAVTLSQACVTVYRDYNFAGRKTSICDNGNVPSGWNDQISSFSVPRGYIVTFFMDYNFGGQSITFQQGRWNIPANYNDQISSLVIYRGNVPQFYGDYNLQGLLFSKSGSANVGRRYNDQVSSIFVPNGFIVTLYSDYNFQGNSLNIFPGVWQAPEGWNDQLSSYKVTTDNGCPIFFGDYNYQGAFFTMCNSGDVPSNFNDQVSSIRIPAAYTLSLYMDYGYQGSTMNAVAGDWEATNGIANWNDVLSSVKVVKTNGCPVFFGDYYYGGSFFYMCSSGNVPSNFNDMVSSIYIPSSYFLTLYADYGFGGTSVQATPNAAGDWEASPQFNDVLSSVMIAQS